MQLELTDAEQELLANLLDNAMRELKEEIYKTETYDYKEQLKEREALLVGLLTRVKQR
jgi:DNA-binding MarR family transcriptional regulator